MPSWKTSGNEAYPHRFLVLAWWSFWDQTQLGAPFHPSQLKGIGNHVEPLSNPMVTPQSYHTPFPLELRMNLQLQHIRTLSPVCARRLVSHPLENMIFPVTVSCLSIHSNSRNILSCTTLWSLHCPQFNPSRWSSSSHLSLRNQSTHAAFFCMNGVWAQVMENWNLCSWPSLQHGAKVQVPGGFFRQFKGCVVALCRSTNLKLSCFDWYALSRRSIWEARTIPQKIRTELYVKSV